MKIHVRRNTKFVLFKSGYLVWSKPSFSNYDIYKYNGVLNIRLLNDIWVVNKYTLAKYDMELSFRNVFNKHDTYHKHRFRK